jgi:hypothetical protein
MQASEVAFARDLLYILSEPTCVFSCYAMSQTNSHRQSLDKEMKRELLSGILGNLIGYVINSKELGLRRAKEKASAR